MPDHENEAELLDDRITLLAPGGRLGGASLAPARNAWPWPAVAVVGVLAAGLFALDSRPGGIVGTASPSLSGPLAAAPTTSAIEVPIGPTPEVAPATQDDGPCGTGRIEIEPVIEPVPADSIGPIRPPAGGMLATAIEQGDTQGSIVVSKTASDGATLSRVVATFSGREIQDPSGVTVVGWTAAGDRFLVQAAHDSGFSADRACANLIMVYADGSGVRYLTDNGPGHWIEAATLAPRTAQVAFVDAGQLRVTDTEAPDGTAKIAPCAAPGLVRWSPDERRLLAICDGNELVVVGATETPKILPIARAGVPLLASWSPDSSAITLVTAPGLGLRSGPLSVYDIDPSTGAATRRLQTEGSAEWAPSRVISPSGEWLLVEGGLLGSNEFPLFVVNLETGVSNRLEWPIFTDPAGQDSVAWLPDGESMLYGDAGILYALNLRERTRTAVGSIPAPDFAWVNRAP